jgi:hypothetical protein
MFVSASILPGGYKYHVNQDGSLQAIEITGAIYDDEIPSAWVGSYWIEGATLASLPSGSNNSTDPSDPRYQAIMGLVSAFVKETHQVWYAASVKAPSVTVRPQTEIDALPVLTSASLG